VNSTLSKEEKFMWSNIKDILKYTFSSVVCLIALVIFFFIFGFDLDVDRDDHRLGHLLVLRPKRRKDAMVA